MTITIGSEYQFTATTGNLDKNFNVVELSSTSFAIVYSTTANGTHYIVAGTISGTVITFGTPVSLGTQGGSDTVAACALSSSLVMVTRAGGISGNSKVCTVSVSGTTCTVNADATLDATANAEYTLTALDATTGLCVYNKSGTGAVAVVITVSGTTCTVNSPVTINGTATYNNSVDKLTSTTAIYGFIDGSNAYPKAAVISVSGTTPSMGSVATIEASASYGTGGGTYQKFCVAVNATTAVMCWFSANADDVRSAAMTISGTTVTGGTVYSIDNTVSTFNGWRASLCAPTSSRIVYSYTDTGTPSHYVKSASLSGATITVNSDRTAMASSNVWDGAIGAVGTGFVCAFNVNYMTLRAVAEATINDSLRYLDLAANFTNLFATGLDTGTLKLFKYDHATLTETELGTFGSCTTTDINNGTNALKVSVNPVNLNHIYVWGYDGNGVQLWYSDFQGSSFVDISGSWGSNVIVGLEFNFFEVDDMIVFLSNDDIYHTTDNGATWTKIVDGPGANITHAERSPIIPDAFIVSSSASGDLDLSINLGVDFRDISITTGASTITGIKKGL